MGYRNYDKARKFVHSLRLKNGKEWNNYCKSGEKPDDIPKTPWHIYRDKWTSMGDWLGTNSVAPKLRRFRSFESARDYIRSLHFKDYKEWKRYCKSGQKPVDIPSNPEKSYKDQWKGIGDWLGTYSIATFNKPFRSFTNARKFVQSLKLKSYKEWKRYIKSGQKPVDIPSNPSESYKTEFKGYGDWLGTNVIAASKKYFRQFEEAREFVHKLRLKTGEEWKRYCKSGQKPDDIPSAPNRTYKKYWKDMSDWLGTPIVASYNKKYRPYVEAREFVHKLRLKTGEEWKRYCKSGKKPDDIPSAPNHPYKKDWKGMGDWLGSGFIATQKREYKPFYQSREFVHKLRLKTGEEWKRYCKSGKKPDDIPTYPDSTYKNKWKGIDDWLGTGKISPKDRHYLPFEQAKKFVHSLNFQTRNEWKRYCKSGKKPDDIPSDPKKTYKIDWKGMGDWLGLSSGEIREYLPFEQAKKFVHSLNIENVDEWIKFCNSGKKPRNIPTYPYSVYSKEWTDWFDWFGKEGIRWDSKKIKELLSEMIKSGVLYNWDEAVLYSFFLRKGILNLSEGNKHKIFLKTLIQAKNTEEGKRAIEDYVNSDSENPPILESINLELKDGKSNEIDIISSKDLLTLPNEDPLDYEVKNVDQILKNVSFLESVNVDEEAIQFYINYSINELWKAAFQNEENTILTIEKEGKNGNKYHDLVVENFLSDYYGSKNLEIPREYTFPNKPTLMQLYVAYKIMVNPFFGNFSGTGAGKTLSAVLASRIIDSKLSVIVCPNDIVEQWEKNILEIFSNSEVVSGKNAFYTIRDNKKYQYLILNYDKFSLEDTPNLILTLVKQNIDFVILDEIHFVKKRDENSSLRRRNLEGLLTAIRKKNANIKILGLSATPIVNNLTEGRSLLELMTGKIYDDVAISPTIPNAVTLYEKLSTISIRELPDYDVDINTEHIEVIADKPLGISIKQLKSNPLSIEQFLTDVRIKYIVKLISGQTIIYTEYITNVIEKIANAVKKAGFSYAFYTGSDRSGLTRFLQHKVQVLIASRPISTGVDGLQKICNRLIINTLPWTNAQYQQLLGRLVRKGQIRDVVNVYVIKASIAGYPYDHLKWNRIQFKRTLADCAIDGRLPEKNLVTPQQAAMEAVRWLERLERGEISTVVRQDLNVELTPIQIEHRITKYGDFSRLNKKFNSENSITTNTRLNKNSEEWREYHRQYREARKTWTIIPYEEIINRIEQLSPRLQIGDFGCGEAKIMEKFGTDRVYSFDHIAINNAVIACDMKKVPIPDDSIDVAVFSLALMGKNWIDYLREAKRCLATNGYLLIAETTKSLQRNEGRLSKLRDTLKAEGFEIYEDVEKGDFTFIEARNI